MVDPDGEPTAKSMTVDELVSSLVNEIFEENSAFVYSVAQRCSRLGQILYNDESIRPLLTDTLDVDCGATVVDFIAEGIKQHLKNSIRLRPEE